MAQVGIGLEDGHYFDILIIGKTGMGKSTTADKLLIANPTPHQYAPADHNDPTIDPQRGQMTLEDLVVWNLRDTPDEIEHITIRLKNLVFFRSLVNPHLEINESHKTDVITYAATKYCELISNETSRVRVLDVQMTAGMTSLNLVQTIVHFQIKMGLKFQCILYFPHTPIEGSACEILKSDLQAMIHYYGKSVLQHMVIVASAPMHDSRLTVDDSQQTFLQKDIYTIKLVLKQALSDISLFSAEDIEVPSIIFISLTDSCETVLKKIKDISVARGYLQINFDSEWVCVHCGMKVGEVNDEKIFCSFGKDWSHSIPYDESTCHPIFVPKYSGFQKILFIISFVLFFWWFQGRSLWQELHVEVCSHCRNEQGTPGCMQVGKEFQQELLETTVDHYNEKIFTESQEVEQVHDLENITTTSFSREITDLQSVAKQIAQELSDIVGETTFVVTNAKKQFHWEECGILFQIYENSLPEGIRQCNLTIKVFTSGIFEFPENSHLVSAVYWIHCEPECKFRKPISVKVQHCAHYENPTELSFVKCRQNELACVFKPILDGNFGKEDFYGYIDLDTFSFLAIIQRIFGRRRYCASLYYRENSAKCVCVYFAITWNTNSHRQALKNHYEEIGASRKLEMPIEFSSTEITLDIPPDDGTTVNGAVQIKPLFYPQVAKSEVDSFRPGRRIPECQLEITPIVDSLQLSRFSHNVKLIGANFPHDQVVISYSITELREPPRPLSRSATCGTLSLSELLHELYPVASQWKTIGALLGIDSHLLDELQSDSKRSRECLQEMLTIWLRQRNPLPSWSAVIDAVESLRTHPNVVEQLQQTYLPFEQ